MNFLLRDAQREAWAMEPKALNALVQKLASIEIQIDEASTKARAEYEARSRRNDPGFENVDGTAVVPIHGVIMKSVPWYYDYIGIEATSTPRVRETIRALLADDDVNRIMLHVDSPGGTVAGTQELADAIFAAGEHKSGEFLAINPLVQAATAT